MMANLGDLTLEIVWANKQAAEALERLAEIVRSLREEMPDRPEIQEAVAKMDLIAENVAVQRVKDAD